MEKDKEKSLPTTSPSPQSLEDFASYTTFHGLHFVVNMHSFLRRIIWFTLILVGIVFLGVQLVLSYGKLQANESIVGTKIIYSNEIKFPAVTLCNMNMMKKSKVVGTDAQYFLEELSPLYILDPEAKKKSVNDSFDIEEAVRDNGHTAKDMIKGCIWDGKVCTYRNFTTFYSFMYGMCHTFNSAKDGHPTLTSTTTRKEKGLNLLIDIEPLEYIGAFSMMSKGVRLLVHDQDTEPMMEEDAMDMMPGFTTNVRLKRKSIISLEPPFVSACGSKKLKTFKSYSTSGCLTECYARIITKRCGCRILGMPVLPELNINKHCNPKDLVKCDVYPNMTRPNSTLVDSTGDLDALTSYFKVGWSFYPNPNMCDCPKQCNQTTFGINLNTAYLPSQSLIDLISEMKKLPPMKLELILAFKMALRAQLLNIYVSYEDLNTEEIKERPAYDWNDFGSNVGGNMGLFLGCSILTICEFIDFAIILIINKFKTKKNAKNISEKPGQTEYNNTAFQGQQDRDEEENVRL